MRVIDSRAVNLDELTLKHFSKGHTFECRAVRIGPLLGAMDLGYSYDVVPPGKRSCPFHSHRAEEEMFFIVKGEGTLRYGNETRRIRAGVTALARAASGAVLVCDDMKMTSDGDGYVASRASDAQVAAVDKAQAPMTMKQTAPVKQKTAGKPIAQGTAVARTGG